MEEAEEIKKIIEEANTGNWIPITIVAAVLGVVLLLILYIWKQNLKRQDEIHEDYKAKHGDHKEWLVKLSENVNQNSNIINKLEMWIEFHEKDHDNKNAS